MKREVQSLKSELRALRTGHLSTSEVRLPWTPEEKLRHESNGHAEYDVKASVFCNVSARSGHFVNMDVIFLPSVCDSFCVSTF